MQDKIHTVLLVHSTSLFSLTNSLEGHKKLFMFLYLTGNKCFLLTTPMGNPRNVMKVTKQNAQLSSPGKAASNQVSVYIMAGFQLGEITHFLTPVKPMSTPLPM